MYLNNTQGGNIYMCNRCGCNDYVFTALAIMILIDSTGTEAIVAMMTMVEMH